MALSRCRLGEQRQDRGVGRRPAGISTTGRGFAEQGIEAVKGRSVVGALGCFLVPGVKGGFGRGDGVAGAPVVGQGIVVEQQRRPGAAQMPIQVPSQQAHEQMRPVSPTHSDSRSPAPTLTVHPVMEFVRLPLGPAAEAGVRGRGA